MSVKIMRYFKESDFACKCCGKNLCSKSFMNKVDSAREEAGVPFILNSAYRCPEHNLSEGGKVTSSHTQCACAVDIKAEDSRTRFRVTYGLIKAGFTRIGIGRKFVHADEDENKDQEVEWLY